MRDLPLRKQKEELQVAGEVLAEQPGSAALLGTQLGSCPVLTPWHLDSVHVTVTLRDNLPSLMDPLQLPLALCRPTGLGKFSTWV